MTAVIHVNTEVEYGAMQRFLDAVGAYNEYRRQKGLVVPEVLVSLSGSLNRVCLVYHYRDLAQFENEDGQEVNEPRFSPVALLIGVWNRSISYDIFRVVDEPTTLEDPHEEVVPRVRVEESPPPKVDGPSEHSVR